MLLHSLMTFSVGFFFFFFFGSWDFYFYVNHCQEILLDIYFYK